MNSKIQALNEAKFARAKEDIDIEELEYKIADPSTNQFDRRRHQLDIDQKLANRPYSDKLINDALVDLNIMYHHFKALPRYTRDEFEAGERAHFEIKLTRQLQGVQGAAEAIANMQDDMLSLAKIENDLKLLK